MSEWIPVTERLPENGAYVLVCLKKGIIFTAHRFTSKDGSGGWSDDVAWWVDDIETERAPIAWMPLPEPYKEDKDDTARD